MSCMCGDAECNSCGSAPRPCGHCGKWHKANSKRSMRCYKIMQKQDQAMHEQMMETEHMAQEYFSQNAESELNPTDS